MFTGLIEKTGKLAAIERRGQGAVIAISVAPWDEPLKVGESVAVCGACLTVTRESADSFSCDVLDETLAMTNLGGKPKGAVLNLERAMRIGDRLGGHIVTGHIDGQGILVSSRQVGRDFAMRFRVDPGILEGIVYKGSITVDGVSLTVSATESDWFEVNIVPHTWANTNLSYVGIGESVNLETDIIGKYVARHLEASQSKRLLGLADLERAGFLQDI